MEKELSSGGPKGPYTPVPMGIAGAWNAARIGGRFCVSLEWFLKAAQN